MAFFVVAFFIAVASVNGIGLEKGLSNTDGLHLTK